MHQSQKYHLLRVIEISCFLLFFDFDLSSKESILISNHAFRLEFDWKLLWNWSFLWRWFWISPISKFEASEKKRELIPSKVLSRLNDLTCNVSARLKLEKNKSFFLFFMGLILTLSLENCSKIWEAIYCRCFFSKFLLCLRCAKCEIQLVVFSILECDFRKSFASLCEVSRVFLLRQIWIVKYYVIYSVK